MSNIYNSKWTRTILRMITIIGLGVCLFFMTVAVFKIQPMYGEFEVLTTTVVFISLSVWLMSLLLNSLSNIDLAERKAKLEEVEEKD